MIHCPGCGKKQEWLSQKFGDREDPEYIAVLSWSSEHKVYLPISIDIGDFEVYNPRRPLYVFSCLCSWPELPRVSKTWLQKGHVKIEGYFVKDTHLMERVL